MLNPFILITCSCPTYSFTRQSNTNISPPFTKANGSNGAKEEKKKETEVEMGKKNAKQKSKEPAKLPSTGETFIRHSLDNL